MRESGNVLEPASLDVAQLQLLELPGGLGSQQDETCSPCSH